MNRILVEKDKLTNYQDEYITINNNTIIFKKSSSYTIEYINCSNINLNIILESNIEVDLFEYSEKVNITINNIYNLNKYSKLNLSKFYDNYNTQEKIIINLNGIYSKIDYRFCNICSTDENYKIIINHNESNTESKINNKSITINNSYLSFTIDSILPKRNLNCLLEQQTRIITLDNSFAKIEPNMYIEEDETEAKHGSVIGKFSNEELFYLQTRGIEEKEALKLLIKGLIFSNLTVDLDKRAKIFNIINEKWR